MKVSKQKKAKRELVTLGALIHNKQVLRCVYDWVRENPGPLFRSKPAQRITEWCLEHYEHHGEEPGSGVLVSQYFEAWEEKSGGGAFCDQVDDIRIECELIWNKNHFLEHQLYTLVESVLRRQQVLLSVEKVDGSSNADSIDEVFASATPVTLTREPEYDSLFEDPMVGINLEKATEPVFSFGDEVLDRFFDDSFAKSTFSAFQGPEKRGKSQWLLECAVSALRSKKRVLYFDAGDMTKDQIFVRFVSRFSKRPYRGDTESVEWIGLEADSLLSVTPEYVVQEWKHNIPQKEVTKIKDRCAALFKNKFISYNFPKGSLTVSNVKSIMDKLTLNGTPVDVVIIDYADILAPSKSKYQDNRFAVAEIWGDLRAVSQVYEVAVITATQADAESYNNDQHQGSFSESKMKNAYITATIAIDKTAVDENVFKLSYLFRRTGSISRSIYVGSDLGTSRPAVKTCWVPRKETKERLPIGKIKN